MFDKLGQIGGGLVPTPLTVKALRTKACSTGEHYSYTTFHFNGQAGEEPAPLFEIAALPPNSSSIESSVANAVTWKNCSAAQGRRG